jgi:hypothetical protein
VAAEQGIDHLDHAGGVEHREHDVFATRAQVAQRYGDLAAGFREVRARLFALVEADARDACHRQTMRQCAADESKADQADAVRHVAHRGNDAPPQIAMSCPVIAAASGDSR